MADDTVPMISPDGSIGDVPKSRAAEAVKAGFKVGAELSKDGKSGIIPLDRVHDAMGAGFSLAPSSAGDVAAASVPRPQLDMQTEGGGTTGPVAGKLTGLPGVNPHTPTAGEAAGDIALVGGGAIAGVAGPSVGTAVGSAATGVTSWASANPVKAYLLYQSLKDVIPGLKKAGHLAGHLPE